MSLIQLMIPRRPSLTLPAQTSPGSLQQACSPGCTDHLPGVAYKVEGWLQLFEDLSQVPATLRWPNLLSQAWQTLSPFYFSFPFQQLLFWRLSKSQARISKDSFHGFTSPNTKTEPWDRNHLLRSVPGKCCYFAKTPEMTCFVGDRHISRHVSRYHIDC